MLCYRVPKVIGMNFVMGIPFGLTSRCVCGIIFNRPHIGIRAGIGLHLIATPTQQFINRHIKKTRLQIPQSHIQHTQHGLFDLGDPQPMPKLFSIKRILPDNHIFYSPQNRCNTIWWHAFLITMIVPTQIISFGTFISNNLCQGLNNHIFG